MSFNKTSRSATKITRHRSLRLESLEDRTMLTVSAVEYAEIRELYSNFGLPASMDSINIIEVSTVNLTNLKNAIDQACSATRNDLIVLRTNTAQTITYSSSNSEIKIDTAGKGSMTIVTYGTGSLTLDANDKCRIMTVDSGTVNLGNMTFTNGFAIDGLTETKWTTENVNYGAGGALFNKGTVRLDGVTISRSTVSANIPENVQESYFVPYSVGGGIYNNGSLYMYDCIVSDNTAESATWASSMEGGPVGIGGGIYNTSAGQLSLYGTSITGNEAQSETCTATFVTEETDEDGNTTTTSETVVWDQVSCGGGIFNNGGYVLIQDDSLVYGNSAWEGGGIYTEADTNIAGSVTINNSTVSNNTAKAGGGGIFGYGYNAVYSSLTINKSIINDNTAGKRGGGILTIGALNLTNSLVAGNRASGYGAGICLAGDPVDSEDNDAALQRAVLITNSTITGNGTSSRAGGIYLYGDQSGALTLVNSIIYNNTGVSGYNGDIVVTIGVVGENGIQKPTQGVTGYNNCSSYSKWLAGSSNNVVPSSTPFVLDYNFSTSTQGNYYLKTGSPAIDSGNNAKAVTAGLTETSVDIAGQSRYYNQTIDRGAYEYCGPWNGKPLTPLDTVQNVYATVVTPYMVDVTWDKIAAAKSYQLEYKLSSDTVWKSVSVTDTTTSDASTCQYRLSGLSGGKTYQFRVRASGDGINWSASIAYSEVASVYTYVDILVVNTTKSSSLTSDELSLAQAVTYAGTSGWGNTIQFGSQLNGKEIILQSTLNINKNITIDASSILQGVTLNAGNMSVSAISVASGKSLLLKNVAIENGASYGNGTVHISGSATLERVRVLNGASTAIYLDFGATLTATDCRISQNTSTQSSGGLYAVANANITLSDCEFVENSGGENGGAIYVAGSSQLSITNCLFQGNSAINGGALYGSDSTIKIDASEWTENKATGSTSSESLGGAIYIEKGSLIMTGSAMTGNMSLSSNDYYGRGAALYAKDAEILKLFSTTVTANLSKIPEMLNPTSDTILWPGALETVYESVTNPTFQIANSIVLGNKSQYRTTQYIADITTDTTLPKGLHVLSSLAEGKWSAQSSHIQTLSDSGDVANLFQQEGRWQDGTYIAGNYQLKPGCIAIDVGSNDLNYKSDGTTRYSKDLAGNARELNGTTSNNTCIIDLGAWEAATYQAPVAKFVTSQTSVVLGTDIVFDASASTANSGRTISGYRWDLNGDGIFGDVITSTPTLVYSPGSVYDPAYNEDFSSWSSSIGLIVVDSTGITSLPTYQKLTVTEKDPVLCVDTKTYGSVTNIFTLKLQALYDNGAVPVQWTINWGDGSSETLNQKSSAIVLSHFYSTVGTFNVTASLFDDHGHGDHHIFSVISHVVSSVTAKSSLPESSLVPYIMSDCEEEHVAETVLPLFNDADDSILCLFPETGEIDSSFSLTGTKLQETADSSSPSLSDRSFTELEKESGILSRSKTGRSSFLPDAVDRVLILNSGLEVDWFI